MRSILFLFASLVCLSTTLDASNVCAESRELHVLRPNGMPAVGAKVTLLRKAPDEAAPRFEKMVLKTDESGWIETDWRIDFDEAVAVIELPGAATGIWAYIRPESQSLQLAESFEVCGVIHDPTGRPVADAEVRVTKFGTYTYVHFDPRFLSGVDGIQCKTGADGEFSLQGMTLNGYGFPAGAGILATKKIDGRLHSAQWTTQYLGDSTALETHRDKDLEDAPIALSPISRIRGRVISGIDGQPLAGAELRFAPVSASLSSKFATNEQGEFAFETGTFGKRRITITHPELPKHVWVHEKTRAITRDNQTERDSLDVKRFDIDEFEIVVWPMTLVRGSIVDEISGKPTSLRLGFHYKRETKIRDGWVSTIRGSSSGVPHGGVQTDGSFEFKLPAGELELFLGSRSYNGHHVPYKHSMTVTVDPKKPDWGQIKIPRNKGLFVQLQSADGTELDREVLDSLIISVSKPGSGSSSYAENDQYWFYPVNEWGDQLTVQIEQRMSDNSRATLLPKKVFTASKDTWPHVIKIDPKAIAPSSIE